MGVILYSPGNGVMAVFIWKAGKSDIGLGIVEKSTIIIEN
jgi:hypothetical protein